MNMLSAGFAFYCLGILMWEKNKLFAALCFINFVMYTVLGAVDFFTDKKTA